MTHMLADLVEASLKMHHGLLEGDWLGAGGTVNGEVITVSFKAVIFLGWVNVAQLLNVSVNGQSLRVQLFQSLLDELMVA